MIFLLLKENWSQTRINLWKIGVILREIGVRLELICGLFRSKSPIQENPGSGLES